MDTNKIQISRGTRVLDLLKAISWWAAVHRRAARGIVMLVYLPFIFLAFLLLEELSLMGIRMPLWIGVFLPVLALLAFRAYPRRQRSHGSDLYLRRKLAQTMLSAVTFFSVVWLFNANALSADHWATRAYGSMIRAVETPKQEEQAGATLTTAVHEHQTVAQRLGKLRQWYSEQKTWVQVLLTVLTCIFATAVFLALAVVSCVIICEGNGVIGVCLFVLGTVGIVMGTIALIRRIWDVGPMGKRRRRAY